MFESIDKIKENILKEINMEIPKPNNERLMPSSGGNDKDILNNKKFNVMLWALIQIKSYSTVIDTDVRYIKKSSINFSLLAKKINLMKNIEGDYIKKSTNRNKVARDFKYLIEIGLIKETNETLYYGDKEGDYYEIKNLNAFRRYNLFQVDFLKALSKNLSEEELRVYMVYYGFLSQREEIEFNANSICFLSQEQILKRAGYYYNGNNAHKLRAINLSLKEKGLIYKTNIKMIIKDKTVQKQVVFIIPYWMTKFYKEKVLFEEIKEIEEKTTSFKSFVFPEPRIISVNK